MSFVEWYEETYKDTWHEDYAGLYVPVTEYEEFCKRNNIQPVWNG